MVYQHSQCLPSKSLNQLSSECLWGMRQKTELLTGKYLKHFWKQIYFSQGEINQRRDTIYLPKKNNTGGTKRQMLQSQAWSISGKFVLTDKGIEIMEGMKVLCEDIPSLQTSPNISVSNPELPPCHHSVILPLVHPITFSAGRVYREYPTAIQWFWGKI